MALTKVSRGLLSTSIVDNGNATAITIDSSENVGIGTTSPDQKLEVDGAVKVTNFFTGETSTNSGYFDFVPSTSTARITTKGNDGSTLGKFQILQQASDGSPSATPFYIDTNSNVGIGTSSPLEKLTVASGNVRLDTSTNNWLYASDTSAVKAGFNFDVTNKMLKLYTNAAERMRIDSSGNVGIGTTSPSRPLYVQDAGTGSSRGISINTATAGGNAGIGFATAGTDRFSIDTVGSAGSEALRVYSWTASTERMRINSSGDLLVGCTTTPSASVDGVMISRTPDITSSRSSTTSSTSTSHWIFYNANGIVGSISTTGSQTVYATSSDQRLKENIADADDAGSKIDAIQVRQYDWKADGSHQDYGMIAQELQTVAPEAVSGDADSEEMMGVDYSKLVPMLIKEIQSLRNRVAQLEE